MKQKPANTAEAAVKAAVEAAQAPLEPPDHVLLRETDRPFWAGVILARAREEWSESDLVVGAQLARCQNDIEEQSALLYEEGMVVRNERGTQVPNARCAVLRDLAQREMALMRTLRIGGAAAGEARHVIERRKVSRDARVMRAELEASDVHEDSLLA